MPIFSQFGEIVWQRLFNITRILQTTALQLSTFSFQSLMLKLTKIFKVWFAMFENTVKINLLCICCLRLHVQAWIHPWIKLIVFFHGFLSDSVEITSCVFSQIIIHLRLSKYCWLLFIQNISPILIGEKHTHNSP